MHARWLRVLTVVGLFLLGAYVTHDADPFLPTFVSTAMANPLEDCTCDRHCDPAGNGPLCNVLDVVQAINVAFRSAPPIPDPNPACPVQTTDVNCSGFTDVMDVVKIINVAFRNGDPALEFCTPCGPAGELTSFSECKSLTKDVTSPEVSSDLDCISYIYGNDSVLYLRHINAGFNCCPDSFTATFAISEANIVIDEMEVVSMPCLCLCLFDLDYRINGLPPGVYTLRVNEPYLWEGGEPLEFTLDLTPYSSDFLCITRENYPWGTW